MQKINLILIVFYLLFSCKQINEDNYPIIEKKYKLIMDPRDEVELIDFTGKETGTTITRIEGHILFYGHNSNFILINQKPRDSIIKRNKENLNYEGQEKKIFNTSYNQYFILEIKNDSIYGPFKKKEYLEFRKKLNIPEKLKLNNSTLNFYISDQRKDIDYYKNIDTELIDFKDLKGNKVSKYKFPFYLFEKK